MAERTHPDRPGHREARARAASQTFRYPLEREFVEPDWRRIPGFRDVTDEQWESAQWQRAHTVKNLIEFKKVLGDHLDEDLYEDILRDQQERATMSMLIPPQMINTMDVDDLRAMLAQQCLQLTVGLPAPDRPDRKRRFLHHRPLHDLITAPAEPDDLVSQGCEGLALLVDDTVLSAGSSRAIAVVDKQDPHPGSVTSHHWRAACLIHRAVRTRFMQLRSRARLYRAAPVQ